MNRNLERLLTLPLAWFPPDRELFGRPMRSLSLLSHQAIRVMGLRVLDPVATYADPIEEMGEVLAYAWLHTAPIDEIGRVLWNGSWREEMVYTEKSAAATLALLAEWRAFRQTILALLAATEIRIRPRPRDPKLPADPTPPDVVGPTLLAAQISVACETLRESKEWVCWELPIWEAWQLYHVRRRGEGCWTVPGVDRSVPEETFENFELRALTPEPGHDGE